MPWPQIVMLLFLLNELRVSAVGDGKTFTRSLKANLFGWLVYAAIMAWGGFWAPLFGR